MNPWLDVVWFIVWAAVILVALGLVIALVFTGYVMREFRKDTRPGRPKR